QIKLEGRLQSTSNIRFDGEMNGDLTTEGDLSVGEHGRVKGNVTGRNVVVGGTIQGNVNTTGRLEILATGKVFGDIVVGSLIIDEGGILRGKSAVHAQESARPARHHRDPPDRFRVGEAGADRSSSHARPLRCGTRGAGRPPHQPRDRIRAGDPDQAAASRREL